MPSLTFDSVSFSYSTARTVFSACEFSLGPGWAGVVGPNGAGKSTLLGLALGSLTPTSGDVIEDAPGGVVLCPQQVEGLTPGVADLAGAFEPEAYVLRGRLDLDPDQLERWETLSPGERRRWQVGAALWARPDILLLDEPTNHLDSESRGLLLDELSRFRGVGMVVSHDRVLLDTLTTTTVRVGGGSVDIWKAPYSAARREWQAAETEAMDERERLSRRLRTTEARIYSRRQDLAARNAAFARTMRSAAPKDHDTHSTAKESKHRSGSARASQALSRLADERDRMAADLSERPMRRSVGGSIQVQGEAAPRPVAVRYAGPLMAGSARLVQHLSIAVDRDARIHLAGPNGAGKSTLLAALRDAWDLAEDRLLYLPQELSDAAGVVLLGALKRTPPKERGSVLQIVARLGVDPDVLLASDQPSPGEARKLLMATGLGRRAWLCLLDEPTNHLDLPAVEALEEALGEYGGALVIVSHDQRFADAVTRERWTLAGGALEM